MGATAGRRPSRPAPTTCSWRSARPRRADAAARAARAGPSSPSRSIGTWRAALRRGPLPTSRVVVDDFLQRDAGARSCEPRASAGASRGQPAVQHLVRRSSSALLALADDGRRFRDATRDAAERGGRPAGRPARDARLGRAVARASSSGRDVETLLTLPPGAFRPAPRCTPRSSGSASGRRGRPSGDRRSSTRWSGRSSRSGERARQRAGRVRALRRQREAAAVLVPAGLDRRRRPETLGLAELAAWRTFSLRPNVHLCYSFASLSSSAAYPAASGCGSGRRPPAARSA